MEQLYQNQGIGFVAVVLKKNFNEYVADWQQLCVLLMKVMARWLVTTMMTIPLRRRRRQPQTKLPRKPSRKIRYGVAATWAALNATSLLKKTLPLLLHPPKYVFFFVLCVFCFFDI